MLWVLKKSIFQIFANIWISNLKPFSGKVRQIVQDCLNQNLVIGSFLGNGFEATLSSETNVSRVWKEHISVFCKFLRDDVETLFWACETKRSKLSKSKFGHIDLLENVFGVILTSKMNVLSIWKSHFLDFWKYFSEEVETIFWEIEARRSKLFKSKFRPRKLLKKCFRSYLKLKNTCCEFLKRVFSRFLPIFESRTWNHFLGKWGKLLKNV